MDQVFLIFLMPVLSAYIFLVLFIPTRFYILRLSGQHLFLQLLIFGVLLFIALTAMNTYLSPVVSNFLSNNTECLSAKIISSLSEIFKFCANLVFITLNSLHIDKDITNKATKAAYENDLRNFSGFIVLAIVIPPFYSLILKIPECLFPNKYDFRKYYDIKNAEFFGGMASIISKLYYDEKAALITLKSKKVYVGYISGKLPRWGANHKTINIFPILSGYRDNNNHLIIVNRYNVLWGIIEFIEKNIEKNPELKEDGICIEGKDAKTGRVIEINLESAINIRDNAAVTFRYEDIDSISMWLPTLYSLHKKVDTENDNLQS